MPLIIFYILFSSHSRTVIRRDGVIFFTDAGKGATSFSHELYSNLSLLLVVVVLIKLLCMLEYHNRFCYCMHHIKSIKLSTVYMRIIGFARDAAIALVKSSFLQLFSLCNLDYVFI